VAETVRTLHELAWGFWKKGEVRIEGWQVRYAGKRFEACGIVKLG